MARDVIDHTQAQSEQRVPAQARALLRRADAELLAAQFSAEAWEKFTHAHLAALRAGAALVAVRRPPARRGGPRTVWQLLDAVAPELERWTGYFADGASLRAAVEAGRFDLVPDERAEDAVCAAEDFVDAVRHSLAEESPVLTRAS